MKRWIIATLVGACIFGSFASCGESSAEESSSIQSSSTQSTGKEQITEQTVYLSAGESFHLKEYGNAMQETFISVEVEDSEIARYTNGVISGVAVGQTSVVAETVDEVYTFPVEVKADTRTDYKLNRGYFYGKKAVFYGDSISAKVGCSGKDYIDYLSDALGNTFSTHSKGGALYTHWTALGLDRESACNLIVSNAEDNQTADYAFMFFGTNDFGRVGGVSLGKNTDAPTQINDVKTVRGAVYFCVNQLRKDNPDLKIMILTPIVRSDTSLTNKNGMELREYGEAIQEMAGLLDCRCINLYEVFTVEEMNGTTYSSDKLHPNTLGHKRIADYLLNIG